MRTIVEREASVPKRNNLMGRLSSQESLVARKVLRQQTTRAGTKKKADEGKKKIGAVEGTIIASEGSFLSEDDDEEPAELPPKEAIGQSYMQRFKKDLNLSQVGKGPIAATANVSIVKEDGELGSNTGHNRSAANIV